ncbi:MAG: hypothetical protein HY711_07690, partial [Candidatus Melainabacteria bacterium]|nr:hypothetical protein [Candidatus Melainabacteria bacterium]
QGQIGGAATGVVVTSENGVCQITVPAGIYSFQFEPPVGGSYEGKSVRQLSVASDLERKVKLAGCESGG